MAMRSDVCLWHKADIKIALTNVRFRGRGKADIGWTRIGVRPQGWTVSCCGFDSVPGVVILELCWA
jgi:hypothetical protein